MVLLALVLSLAHASDSADVEDALDAELVVTPDRSDSDAFHTARAVHVVDAEDIADRQARDLAEALEGTAGVWMQRTNRGSGTPFLRGLSGPQNLMVLDGIPHNLSTYRTGPNQYLRLLDPLGAARVEVVRGPSSVLYGNGAMGGVVQVLTEDPLLADGGVWDGRAALGVGTADDTRAAHAQVRAGGGRVGILLGGSVLDHDRLRTGGGDIEPLSDFREGTWRAKLRVDAGQGHTVDAAWHGFAVDDAGRTDALAEGEVRFYDNRDDVARLGWRYQGDGVVRTASARAAFHRWVEVQDRYKCRTADDTLDDLGACLTRSSSTVTGGSERDDRVSAWIVAGDTRLAVVPDRVDVLLGGEGQWEAVESTRQDRDPGGDWEDAERGNFSPGSTYRVGGAFAFAEVTPAEWGGGRSRVVARGGARYSLFGASAADVPLPDESGDVMNQTVDYARGGLVGSGGVSLVLMERLHVFGGTLQGFRVPNLEETTIFGPEESRFSVPNDALDPERSDTVEVGVRYRDARLRGGVVGWMTSIANALDDAPTTFGGESESADGLVYSHRVNVDGARYRGVEAEAGATVERWSVDAHVASTRGETDDDDEVAPARRVPPLFGGAQVRHDRDGWWLAAATRFAGTQDRLSSGDESDLRICAVGPVRSTTWADQGRDCPGSPGWTVVDLRAGVDLSPGLGLNVALNNVLDADYRVHGSGIDGPGREVRATLVGAWGRGR